jgi:hypothetical protein
MFSMIKTALAAAIVLGSLSVAPAQAQAANFGHRHPAHGTAAERLRAHSFQNRDVSLRRERAPSAAEEEWMDRASANVGGGDK